MRTSGLRYDSGMLNRVGGVGKLGRTEARKLVRLNLPNNYAPFIDAESYQFSAGEKRSGNADALDSFQYGARLNVDYSEESLVGRCQEVSVGTEEYEIEIGNAVADRIEAV